MFLSPAVWLVLNMKDFVDFRQCSEVPTSGHFDRDLQNNAFISTSTYRCNSKERDHWSKIHGHSQDPACLWDRMKNCGSLMLKIWPSVLSTSLSFQNESHILTFVSPLHFTTSFGEPTWHVGWLSLVFPVIYQWKFKTVLIWNSVPICCNSFFWPDFSFSPWVTFDMDKNKLYLTSPLPL